MKNHHTMTARNTFCLYLKKVDMSNFKFPKLSSTTITGSFLVGFLVIFLAAVWAGFVLHTLWGWFMVPNLGVPQISIAQSLGITVIMRMIVSVNKSEKQSEVTDIFSQPFGALVAGFIIQFFM
jgi:hypothetical protein